MSGRRVACIYEGEVKSVIVVLPGEAGQAFLRGEHAPRFSDENGESHPYSSFEDVTDLEPEPQIGSPYPFS